MRVLLDECLPRKLKGEITGHTVATVPQMKWAGKKNGVLLRAAEGRFDVIVTIDGSLQFQQNLKSSSLAIIILDAPTNRLQDLRPLVPNVLRALDRIQPGDLVRIEAETDRS